MTVLVWDFGGPVLRTPFELRHVAERAYDLPTGTLAWTGPFDPDGDGDWREFQSGGITEREYWARRGDEWAALVGLPDDLERPRRLRSLMDALFAGTEADLIRPESAALTARAVDAGHRIAVLTNDLRAFHGDEWIASMRFFDHVEVLVDGSTEGILKPDPRIYQLLLDRLGVGPADVVFVDDQPANGSGAQALGIPWVPFDVLDVDGSLARAESALGHGPRAASAG